MVWQPDYVSSAELKAELKITDGVDDLWCAAVVTAASRAVDRHCSGDRPRQFGKLDAPATRYYPVTYRAERGRWVAKIDDVMTAAGLAVAVGDVSGDVITGAALEPLNAAADGKPWTRLALAGDWSGSWPTVERVVAVTATWGWLAVPSAVKTATMLQAMRFYARRDSPYGVAGSPELGSELRLLQRVDPDVGVILTNYVRPAATA